MPITAERRAEINRQNAQKSTGPRTDAGKAASRRNALTHGLAATTIDPVDAPGEAPGAYQARLDAWVADLNPRNVLELAMVQRACRASWKLDRCARYEDAAAALRQFRGGDEDPDNHGPRHEARQLGALLMFHLTCTDYADTPPGPPPTVPPHPLDDAPLVADTLGRTPEGIEWLLNSWAGILAYLPDGGDGPPPEGSDEFLRRCRLQALRLLGVPTGSAPHPQPLRQAGEAEVRRLRASLDGMAPGRGGHLDADLALFGAGPEAQLLMRYESQAERELHRAVNTFLKLRKDPDLVPPAEPEPEPAADAPAVAESHPPSTPGAAREPADPPRETKPAPQAVPDAPAPPFPARVPRNGPP